MPHAPEVIETADPFVMPIEKLSLAEFKRYVKFVFEGALDHEELQQLPEGCSPESPIEWKLYFAMRAIWYRDLVRSADFDAMSDYYGIKRWTVIEPQKKIGSYRVDFLITKHWAGNPPTVLAVECDGHDFHEKTKLQAQRDKKRDRDLACSGLRVLRFTGSEIYKDPFACAFEIDKIINQHERNWKYTESRISDSVLDWSPYEEIKQSDGKKS